MSDDLDAARAVSDLLHATEQEPISLADELSARRERRNDDGVARWRAWLAEHLDNTLALSDDELERRHDFIQWLFPLGSPSPFNRDAPVIGRHAMREAVSAEPALREALIRSWSRMLTFYGLAEDDSGLRWLQGPASWSRSITHNDRRLSRMLHCLHSAGLTDQAGMLMAFLEQQFAGDAQHAERLSWWRHQVLS